ncbi:iron-sulfur cluster repair di-iron protein [Belliella pelovolcani]|uniref:iron-sulfur cluster repair di-iron protein n=1 Tax=Belliella pelovolcani TaxID=529505 RepID=UPI00391B7C76
MIKELANRKVGGIVVENFKTAKVFTRYGIDFCCKGRISVSDACEKNGVELSSILADLEQIVVQPEEVHYKDFGLSQLIDHIVTKHHSYVEETIPALKIYLPKLAAVHGGRHPELFAVAQEFLLAADALTTHMKKEELVLFPYIKAMEEADSSGFSLSEAHFGHINNPIGMMEHEHDTEGERFRKIAALTNGYTCPPDGCQTYKVAFAMLKEFEEDLHTHIHLENNILFPKAVNLYQKLNA